MQIDVPVFPSLNIDKTIKFHQEKLGFSSVGCEEDEDGDMIKFEENS